MLDMECQPPQNLPHLTHLPCLRISFQTSLASNVAAVAVARGSRRLSPVGARGRLREESLLHGRCENLLRG